MFDEDAEPFDLDEDDLDVDEDVDDELDEATEDDVDLVVGAYREDGEPVAVPLDFELANDLDELIATLRRLPGDSGADGYVSVAGEFFIIARVRGRDVEVMVSDAVAANDWPIARDVVDFLGEEIPDEDEESFPLGDLDMFAVNGVRAEDLEFMVSDYSADPVDVLERIAQRLKFGPQFQAAAASFED